MKRLIRRAEDATVGQYIDKIKGATEVIDNVCEGYCQDNQQEAAENAKKDGGYITNEEVGTYLKDYVHEDAQDIVKSIVSELRTQFGEGFTAVESDVINTLIRDAAFIESLANKVAAHASIMNI